MPRARAAHRGRMHLRIDVGTKRALERAAAYEAKSVTEFVLTTASAAAAKVIDRHEKVTLSKPDWDLFYAALLKPPAPNAALKKAIRRFRAAQSG
jgi:uncharacterized protein (DUF1778 family)